jgi:hypothetical protein
MKHFPQRFILQNNLYRKDKVFVQELYQIAEYEKCPKLSYQKKY